MDRAGPARTQPAGPPFHLGLFATAGVPQIVEGDGVELVAADGRRYLDACSGAISVNSLGYGNEPVVEAVAAQLRRLSYTMPFRLTNDRALELAAAMNEVSAGAIERAMFYTGGSEAVEAALKLARNYHFLNGRAEKELAVARVHSYHGNTVAALSVGGVRQRREPYAPLLSEGPRVALPRDGHPPDPVAETGPNVHGHGVAEDLRELVDAVGAERVSAFIMEPVGGAGAPGHAPADGYFEGVREICDEHDIVLIADEVITGLGRTGRMFGSDHWAVDPDLWVCAKGLAAGYWPIAMVGMSRRIASAFAERNVDFVHGHTFENHAVGLRRARSRCWSRCARPGSWTPSPPRARRCVGRSWRSRTSSRSGSCAGRACCSGSSSDMRGPGSTLRTPLRPGSSRPRRRAA